MCENPDSPVPLRRRLIQPPANPCLKKGPFPDPNLSACCGQEIIYREGNQSFCSKCSGPATPVPAKKY